MNQSQVNELIETLGEPFWTHPDFWIFLVLALVGLYFSFRAFREANAARRAAIDAGRTVKIQTVTIELSEVSQRLDSIGENISYTEARNLLAEITRKLRRVVSPFSEDESLKLAIDALKSGLESARDALRSVRPTNENEDVPDAGGVVYYGVESEFSNVNNLVADLIGLLERGVMRQGGG